MKQRDYLYDDPLYETQPNRPMHYRNAVDPFGIKVKHGRRTKTLEGFHGQHVKHNPISHELLKHRSSICE
jgi:hypothetical protein